MKRNAEHNADVVKRFTKIETSIIELSNEDLLDLADILVKKSGMAITRYAFAVALTQGQSNSRVKKGRPDGRPPGIATCDDQNRARKPMAKLRPTGS